MDFTSAARVSPQTTTTTPNCPPPTRETTHNRHSIDQSDGACCPVFLEESVKTVTDALLWTDSDVGTRHRVSIVGGAHNHQ